MSCLQTVCTLLQASLHNIISSAEVAPAPINESKVFVWISSTFRLQSQVKVSHAVCADTPYDLRS